MKKRIALCLSLLAFFASSPVVLAQKAQSQKTQPQKSPAQAAKSPSEESEKRNIQAYIDLMRSNVRQEKAQIMGAVLQLDADEATKFWPIYGDYDAELTKLNNLRSDNIQEYARSYTEMTDEKADELIKTALSYQKQRSELLGKYYELVKQALGAINAARFLQIENQLLLIIDLQIASSLPIVGQ